MKIRLHPRFFVFLSISLLLVGFLVASRIMKKSSNEKLNTQVLAASNVADPYALIQSNGSDGSASVGSDGSAISEYRPVTISHAVKNGETIYTIAEKYHASPQTIVDFPNNNIGDNFQLEVGQIIIIPNGYIDEAMAPPLPPIARGTGQFSWPARGEVTQYAFFWHPGAIDIALPQRTEVRAADDGTVKLVQYLTTGYGVHVIIDHGDSLTSLYGHLAEIKVTQGQGIRKGDLIGLSGSTGRSTGPHLHFEVRQGAAPVDPMTLLPSQ